MTSLSGYRRLAPSADTFQTRMWSWMRAQQAPWTVLALTDATGASERQARRFVQRLAAAGYLSQHGEVGGDSGQIPARLWLLDRDSGPLAPILVGGAHGDDVADLNSTMTGTQLRAIRKAAGLSASQFGVQALGVRDQRTVRRYEQAAIVPAPAAARARAFARENKLRPASAQK
jgi:hypothetical protein